MGKILEGFTLASKPEEAKPVRENPNHKYSKTSVHKITMTLSGDDDDDDDEV